MNIIGKVSEADLVLKDILQSGKVDLVDAMTQIEENNFLFDVSDENIDRLIDLNSITTFEKDERYDELLKKGEELKKILGIETESEIHETAVEMKKEDILNELDDICEEVNEPNASFRLCKGNWNIWRIFMPTALRSLRNSRYP
jgi:V/A-type H+-transporting ATPase subunit I